MIERVAVPVLDGVSMFELGVLCEVFGLDRPDEPTLPSFDFRICAEQPGKVTTRSGIDLDVAYDFSALDDADLIAVAPVQQDQPIPADLLERLRAAMDRGARILSVCSGAFVLGEAGLLDGRDCTTHWVYVDELAERFPEARVACRSLYVQDGPILTSAGTAAGIDACLHIVREEFGERVANRLARRMVVPPHRDGGQQQYVDTPMPAVDAETLQGTLEWMGDHLADDLTVDGLAARVHMSPRTFARRFRSETGTTPHHWLIGQRVLLAQRLLEESELGIDLLADRAGFGSAAVLRHHFVRRVGTTPQAYRRTFRRQAG